MADGVLVCGVWIPADSRVCLGPISAGTFGKQLLHKRRVPALWLGCEQDERRIVFLTAAGPRDFLFT
jgi:hypothetical protein